MSELSDDLLLESIVEQHYAPGDFTRKGPSYLASYARLLEGRRGEKLRLLELGVSSGASLLVWRDYLPHATIVGIDLADPPARILNQERIHFIQGSQGEAEVLQRAVQIVDGMFDIIIDDASHVGYLTKRSLQYLFPRHLAPGGCYVIEDFGTGFMSEYPDGKAYKEADWNDAVDGTTIFASSQHGMVGVVKQLVEPMMQELMTGTRPILPIKRLVIETNIVFIEKSTQPGRTAPALPEKPRHETQTPGTGHDEMSVRDHEARISRLEQQMNVLRTSLAPFRYLRRFSRMLKR